MRRYKVAMDNELQVDLDSGDFERFNKVLGVIKGTRKVAVTEVVKTPSKSAGHWHVSVYLDRELSVLERILLQACLGSDPVREVLSWSRAQNDDTAPVLFIEPFHANEPENEDYDGDFDSGVFGLSLEEPLEANISCDCDISGGRCHHLRLLQQSNPIVNYGVRQ